ncbi:MAG TPA: S53 family peptidase [Ktedonobacteraceae bacterium]|jgi:kumamolisin
MRRSLVSNGLFCMLAVGLMAGSVLTLHLVARANQDTAVALSGQSVPLVQRAHFVRAADVGMLLHLSIGLRPADSAGLQQTLQAIYTPGSPDYHRYLTAQEFTRRFAPDPQQVQQVVFFLQGQGISVQSIAPNRLLIDASVPVGVAERVFHIQINEYTYANQIFYANAQAPAVPAALQPVIRSIGGLDNSVRAQPHLHSAAVSAQARAATSGYGPGELSRAYDTLPLAQASIQGEGQTVALFELDGYQTSDIQQYFQHYSLGLPTLSNVLVDGASGTAGQDALEAELDIEVIGALAPRAVQIIYEGPNSTQGLNDTYNRMVTDNQARVISTSWGLCESSMGQAEILLLDTIFEQAAAQGISIYAAAGDAGAYDCGDSNLAVDSPADDPYVSGVGGTHLQVDAKGNYSSEVIWADASDTRRSPAGAGGGGGVSSIFIQPAWQTGSGVISGYSSGRPCGAPSGQYCRQVPDIAAAADPASGYAVYCTVAAAGCAASGWLTAGGTSAAAPFWAGSSALINQYLQQQNLPGPGSASAALYRIFNGQQAVPAFHDITTGDNLHYPASAGYDMASGLGSPDISNLAQDLAAGSPPPVPTGVPTPQTPTPLPGTNLLKNTGFEHGQKPWQETSSGGYQLISTLNPHEGQTSAYLCGYSACDDRIWQGFLVPGVSHFLSLSYWWFAESVGSVSACLDGLTVVLQTAAGKRIKTLQHNCNSDPAGGWEQMRVDCRAWLAPYRGQRVTLQFRATTPGGSPWFSAFFIDDVQLVQG